MPKLDDYINETYEGPRSTKRPPEPAERPKATDILRQLYWTVRKNPAAAGHVARAIAAAALRTAAMRMRRRCAGPTTLAIAMIEHMGDIAAAEPLARAASAAHPDARIVWITRAPYRSLPDLYPEIDETIVVGCLTEWLLMWSRGAVDIGWDLHLSGRACPICNARFNKPGLPGRITYANYYDLGTLLGTQAMAAGVEPPRFGPRIETPPATRHAVDELMLPDDFVVIHAKSNEECRDWPQAKWIALVDHLRRTYAGHLVEIGSRAVVPHSGDRRRNLCGKLTILESADVIRRARLFIGIDSGPAHLANAVGTPGVILIGDHAGFSGHMPYDGAYSTPQGATIVRANGPVIALGLEDAIRAVDRRLGAS